MSMLDVALGYAARGLRVFPLRPREKRPANVNGCTGATTEPSEIAALWTSPACNVGIAAGIDSGVLVVDVDGDEGRRSITAWQAMHGALPPTPTVRTINGVHMYFRHPGEQCAIRNSASKAAHRVDVRTDGGYVVAPPSVHPDGGTYEWAEGRSLDDLAFAEMPEWLIAKLADKPAEPAPAYTPNARSDYGHTRYGQRALDEECMALARHPEGGRNQKLNEVAFRIGQLVASRHLVEGPALSDLYRAAKACGLEERETRATIASGLKAGHAKPSSSDPNPDESRERKSASTPAQRRDEQESEQPEPEVREELQAHEVAERALLYLTDETRHKLPRGGFSKLDNAIGGWPPGALITVGGRTGCITGDAMIGINRAGIGKLVRLDKLVAKFNGAHFKGEKDWRADIPTFVRARLDTGVVGLVRLREAYVSGVKPVYTVRLQTGHVVAATKDHRFLSADGWKPLGEIQVGESVYIENGREPCKSESRKQKATYRLKTVRFHPYAGRKNVRSSGSHTVPVHRLVAEAHRNGLSLDDFVARCNRPDGVDGLEFLNPKIFAVHHRDEDPRNNSFENLEVLTHSEHNQRHIGATIRAISVTTKLSRVESIDYAGEQATYDLSLDEPHNFIASGVVVHNSGKSSLMLSMALRQIAQSIPLGIVSCEDPDQVWGGRLLGAWAGVDTRKYLNAMPSEYDAGLCVRAIRDARDKGLTFSFQIGKPIERVKDSIKRMVERDGARIVYVDYLQAILAKGQDRYVARTDALQELKGLCYDLRVPLVMGSQLKRPENGNPFREPTSSDLKDSGDIENMSEVILLLWPKSDDQGAPVFGKVAKVKWSDARPRFQLLRSQTSGTIVDLIDAPNEQRSQHGGDRFS